MALSHVEAIAASALFSGDVARVREEVENLARRLAGADGNSSRHQLIYIQLAIAHVHLLALKSILGSIIKAKNEAGALLFSRLLTDATRRVSILAGAHAGRPRPVLSEPPVATENPVCAVRSTEGEVRLESTRRRS